MKLSVIVPVYNVERWLPACLDSLLVKDLPDYEVIAVDDGSTDSSPEILSRYQARWPDLLRIVTTPNGGLGHARNCGIAHARGEYLAFVDSDDSLSPGAVSEMIGALEPETDIVVFDYVSVTDDGRELECVTGCEREGVFSLEEEPDFLLAPHNAWNKIWRRSLFTDSGISFPDRLWFEDLAAVPLLYVHAARIRPVRRCWYRYLQRSGSIMGNTENLRRNAEMIKVADSVLEAFRNRGVYERFLPQLEYKFFYEEYLAAVCRVNRADPASLIQTELRDDYLMRFPEYRKNPYVRSAPLKYRLLDSLIRRGNWNAVHTLMGFSSKMKGR